MSTNTETTENRIQFEMKKLLSSNIKKFNKNQEDENKKILNDMTLCLAQEINKFKGSNKYIINSILFEKGSNEIIMSGICLWDNKKDKHVKFEIEHQDFTCIITVWIVSFD